MRMKICLPGSDNYMFNKYEANYNETYENI